MDLFAYGTLVFPAVMEAVTGRRVPARPAALEDHAALLVQGQRFPGLVARPGARAAGVLYGGLEAEELAALDAYEGEDYARRVLEVVCGGMRRPAQVYVPAPGRALVLSETPWDPSTFGRRDLEAWVRSCRSRGRRR